MAKIKCSLDAILIESKSTPISALEVQLDFLVSKLFHGDKQASHEFYAELIGLIEKSSMSNKNEVVNYLKARYADF